ncbi:MAG: hypothetical protein HQK53_18895 [Oligoflexia bacterium]|nr:hypothetical protein [Oligoflexia bacterium]
MDYLKPKQIYIDRYDLFTINECLEMLDVCKKAYVDGKAHGKENGLDSTGEWAKASNWLANQMIFQIVGNRYKTKAQTIEKWMADDSVKQDKYNNTPSPDNISCPNCGGLMKVGMKQLDFVEQPLRMMFIFECEKCKKRQWVYEDGTIRESKLPKCPKCGKNAKMSLIKESKDKVIWKTSCDSCDYSETTTDEFVADRVDFEKREEYDKQLLEKYRAEYCADEVGKKSQHYIEGLPVAKEVFDEQLRKYDSQTYQNVVSLKKLSIVDLEKLLNGIFEKERYIHLVLGHPEIGRHVIVGFTVQDSSSSGREKSALKDLEKILKTTLISTNWRLITDSLSSRLGYVTGRVKGYENEEDFFEISGEKPEKIKESKIDPKVRMEHEGDNVVQLAKLTGEFEGIQNTRKRRLQHDPEGFFLEDDGVYTCGICGENYSGNKIWWTPEVLRCADCWRNINNGTIPALGNRYDDDSEYIQEWFLSSDSGYGIHPSTVRKYQRQGILHSRDLKRENGTIYCTIYLLSENEEFLKAHPRKERTHMKITDLLGNEVEI